MHASISGAADISGWLVAAACLLATAASAQSTGGEGLSPTLANIKNTIPCGSAIARARRHSRSSITPTGRSVQSRIVRGYRRRIGVEVDDPNLKIEYVKVTSDDRIPAVTQNKIDLECGSTTANAERAKLVAFSTLCHRHTGRGSSAALVTSNVVVP